MSALSPDDIKACCYWCPCQALILGGVILEGRQMCAECARKTCRRCGQSLAVCVCRADRCERCGVRYGVGQWPFCKGGHDWSSQLHTFAAYFDVGLGIEVNNPGDRYAAMRGEKTCDGDVIKPQLDYREKVSPGELSARRDRIEQQRSRSLERHR
jgi:hypothetical protein